MLRREREPVNIAFPQMEQSTETQTFFLPPQRDLPSGAGTWRTGGLLLPEVSGEPEDTSVLAQLPKYREGGGHE